ncbi:hypothetical protein J3L18_21480 [Mucilaginibacter gossypii]|uniref:hypothetical protein n=1 Tax=Mucilaginibacter gossypii TaxID=551996 RepID=UPI000DCE427A|nr:MULTISPECIES: hypothetical protein [Mucilaginibacter]QTE35703.1 hypothetical protein J3L18_21480 [Mucilaginibacter gossypii]RAV56937.1 hypothetical protein DIU36_14310 [Mucilaginibacter rubeus]
MKRIFISLVAILLLIAVVMSLTGYNLTIPVSKINNNRLNPLLPKVKPGERLQLFSNCDFSKDDWTAYIVIAPEDFDGLNPLMGKRICWKTNSRTLLAQMKKNWVFKYRENDDMATVNSSFYLIRDGHMVFESGIVLDKNNQGLQNLNYGWMQPVDGTAFVNVCRGFEKIYWPVVLF